MAGDNQHTEAGRQLVGLAMSSGRESCKSKLESALNKSIILYIKTVWR